MRLNLVGRVKHILLSLVGVLHAVNRKLRHNKKTEEEELCLAA